MKATITLLIFAVATSLYAQSFEDGITDCINTNFLQIEVDYTQVLSELEHDLMANNIIDDTEASRIKQIRSVAMHGQIETARTYENILWEQLGLRTIKYCVERNTYSSQDTSPSPIFEMLRKIESISLKHQETLNLSQLRMEIAEVLLKYHKNTVQFSKLWKIIQLDFLSRFSETPEMKEMVRLIEPIFKEQDTANTVRLHVGTDDIVTLEHQRIETDEICNELKPALIDGKGIYLTNERGTNYGLYLETYRAIKGCVTATRAEKSFEAYGQPYENLNPEERERINQMIPMRIIESPPK